MNNDTSFIALLNTSRANNNIDVGIGSLGLSFGMSVYKSKR